MGGQFGSMGISIIAEQILGGMLIIYKEYFFGGMVLQLLFSLSGGSHIDTTYKGPKRVYVILLGCSFLNRRINLTRFWKIIVN